MAALLLGGCSSAPSQFYTLVPPAVAGAPPAAAGFRIELEPVDLPPQVTMQQLVVRTGGGEVVPVETRRWIAPLGDEIRQALSADLGRQLGAPDVYGLADASQQPGTVIWRIDLKVQRFDSALGAYARIDALWTLRRDGGDAVAATCSSSVTETVAPGYEALVEGHQRALAELAGQIATGITAAQRGAAAACAASG
jgi:uncharacterized lipoprotein YmbA